MGQSSFLIGAIGFGFVVFVTLKGELPSYIAVFIGKADTGSSSGGLGSLFSGGIASALNKSLPVGGVNGTGVGTLEPGTQTVPGISEAPSTFGSGEPLMGP